MIRPISWRVGRSWSKRHLIRADDVTDKPNAPFTLCGLLVTARYELNDPVVLDDLCSRCLHLYGNERRDA